MKNFTMIKYFAIVLMIVFAVSAKVSSSSNSKSAANLNKILNKMKSLKRKMKSLKIKAAELETLKQKVALMEKEKEAKKIADMKMLKSRVAEMEILKQKVSEVDILKRKLDAIEQEKEKRKISNVQIQTLQRKVDAFENEKATRNGICRIKNNPCGGRCICVEDYRLINKYFCDCRSQTSQRDCKEHHRQGARINGLYTINNNINGNNIQVFCDQITDGGGWTVIQRRMDASENFYRSWTEYKLGFGELHREHWLGNDNIFYLTAQAYLRGSKVRFDMLVKGASTMEWAKYSNFNVNNEASGYKLHVSGYSGNIRSGDKFKYDDGMKFSTYDRDNDASEYHCAVDHHGAWWYNDCYDVNPNGRYDRYGKDGNKALFWYLDRLTFIEMKVRRK